MADASKITTPAAPDNGMIPPGSRLGILAVGTALFMQFADSTALTTALPTLAHEFSVRPEQLKLVLTTYIIVQALFLPAGGWIADRFGPRKVFMSAMLIFLLGSVLCSLSHTLPQMVGGRIIQGLGGSMMVPVGRIIVVASSPREKLIQALMWLGMPVLLGPILGPSLAGLILTYASWPWIFLINIPIGVLGLVGVLRFVPPITHPHPGAFDLLGFVLVAVVIGAVMTLAQAVGGSDALLIGAIAAALVFAAAYVLHERRRKARGARPVLDLDLFSIKTLRTSIMGGNLVRLSIGGNPYLMALLLQSALHWPALKAGVVVTTGAFGALLARLGAPTAIRLLGFRRFLVVTGVTAALLNTSPVLFRADTPVAIIMVLLLMAGFIQSAHLNAINALAFADVPKETISGASTLSSVFQQMSLGLGVTVAGVLLQVARGGEVTLAPRDFLLPFVACGLLAGCSTFFYLQLHQRAGSEVSGS